MPNNDYTNLSEIADLFPRAILEGKYSHTEPFYNSITDSNEYTIKTDAGNFVFLETNDNSITLTVIRATIKAKLFAIEGLKQDIANLEHKIEDYERRGLPKTAQKYKGYLDDKQEDIKIIEEEIKLIQKYARGACTESLKRDQIRAKSELTKVKEKLERLEQQYRKEVDYANIWIGKYTTQIKELEQIDKVIKRIDFCKEFKEDFQAA